MGCLCSKTTAVQSPAEINLKKTSGSKSGNGAEVFNPQHKQTGQVFQSTGSGRNGGGIGGGSPQDNSVMTIDIDALITERYNPSSPAMESLLRYPLLDHDIVRHWIHKRGHVVRSWKKRFCVVHRNEIRYYSEPQDTPPYGKRLKGQVALFGAVCLVKGSANGQAIEVEIYGNHGEKDLFFYVDNTRQGQIFIRMLEWSIRKVTITMLVRGAKIALGTTKKGKKQEEEEENTLSKDSKYNCMDWLAQQESLFKVAIQKMRQPPIQKFQFLLLDSQGSIWIETGLMKLWNVFGDESIPTISTDSTHYGLVYEYLSREEYQERNGKEGGISINEEVGRIITFADIEDYYFHHLDNTVSENLAKELPSRQITSTTTTATTTTATTSSNYLVLTIQTIHGHALHLLANGLHDYDGFLLALQNVLLYINKEQKLRAASALNAGHALNSNAVVALATRMLTAAT
eukprot:gene9485-10476_t